MTAAPPKAIADALPPPCSNMAAGVFRRWFDYNYIEVYVRVNQRVIDGRAVRTLELSNVEVQESMRGTNRFSRLLDGMMTLADQRGEVLLVENVISDIVRGAVLRRGFTDYQGNGANYVKMNSQPTNEGDL
jgi:hypothetical protein